MDKLYIIKIGGNIIDDEKKLSLFLEDFASIKERKILVHGGGKTATAFADKLGVQQEMIDGRRITNSETLKIVTMVYAGFINKNIIAKLQATNCNAIGISGADGNAVLAHKRKHVNQNIDYGFAGDIDEVNIGFLTALLDLDITPVVCPITHDKWGQLLNTNADTMANEIAKSLSHTYHVELVYIFEKAGVLLDMDDEESLIKKLNRNEYKDLKEKKQIFAGMIPKLDNAFAAIDAGVETVRIGKAEQIQKLLKGGSGTTILND